MIFNTYNVIENDLIYYSHNKKNVKDILNLNGNLCIISQNVFQLYTTFSLGSHGFSKNTVS